MRTGRILGDQQLANNMAMIYNVAMVDIDRQATNSRAREKALAAAFADYGWSVVLEPDLSGPDLLVSRGHQRYAVELKSSAEGRADRVRWQDLHILRPGGAGATVVGPLSSDAPWRPRAGAARPRTAAPAASASGTSARTAPPSRAPRSPARRA